MAGDMKRRSVLKLAGCSVAMLGVPAAASTPTDVFARLPAIEEVALSLRSAGQQVRFIRQEFAGHVLSHQPYRLEFFRELEAFLTQNMRVRAAIS